MTTRDSADTSPRASRRSRLRQHLRTPTYARPVLVHAFDAALAASLAWALVQLFSGVADSYPYYAPLGAVVAVAGSVLTSVYQTFRTIRDLVLGAFLGTALQQLDLPTVVGLALIVGLGTAFQGRAALVGGGSWICYSGILVLILGSDSPLEYGFAYASLTTLGALVGIAVLAVLPPVLTSPGSAALASAGRGIAGQLDDLADGLRFEEAPGEEDWQQRRHRLEPVLRELSDEVRLGTEVASGNWRARRNPSAVEPDATAVLLSSTFPMVEHLTLMLTYDENLDRTDLALGAELRPHAADALAAWADVVRALSQPDAEEDAEPARQRLTEALDQLTDAVRESRTRTGHDEFTAGSLVSTVRRGLELTTPGWAPPLAGPAG